MRSWVASAIVATLALLGTFDARAQDSLRIAAVVNDQVISMFDLQTRMSMVITSSRLQDTPQIRQRLAPQVLRSLIDETLKLQAAKKLGVHVEKKEIDGALQHIAERNHVPTSQFMAFLRQKGIRTSDLIEQIQSEIAWSKVISKKFQAQTQVSPEEVNDVIREIDSYKGKPEYRVAEIFLPFDSGKMPQVVAVADRLSQQLAAGADFYELARSFSRGPTAPNGGDLGWVHQGQLDPELDRAVQQMKPGQVSKPIHTLTGIYILYLRDRRAAVGLVDPKVTLSLQQLVFNLPEGADAAATQATVQQAAARTAGLSSCAAMQTMGEKMKSPLSGSLGEVVQSKLPDNIRNAVSQLPVDKASRPIVHRGNVVVLMVCKRQSGDQKKLREEARHRIEQRLYEKRIEDLGQQYLRELRREAFVDIRL